MALSVYNAKRRFDRSPEPRGRKAAGAGHAYVIQKHAARRLHYDLRLELGGAMLSWAVPKGPSLIAGDKRLAVRVEDHPVDYNRFEGVIPEGEYGAGTVMVWDRGEWFPEGDARAALRKGHLAFRLDGEKLSGAWHLLRMKPKAGERQEPWLLVKADDEAARSARAADILDEAPLSVASGRDMNAIAAGDEPPTEKRRPRARALRQNASRSTAAPREPAEKGPPDFVPPCLARLADKAPESDRWLHEVKFDGYRMQARLAEGRVRLRTRTGLDWTDRFASVADALTALECKTALIDGEIVVETPEGLSSFSALQEALANGSGRFVYYVFDLLHLNGRDLARESLEARRAALVPLIEKLPRNGTVRLSEAFDTAGPPLLEEACRLSLEGIISKRRDAPYRSGRRGDWLKIKCGASQEFVVSGFTPASSGKGAVGSLVLGYHRDGALHYAGRVGTGFTAATARDLWRKLEPLRRQRPPFAEVPAEERRRLPVWVRPVLVAEIEFRGWTGGGRLRHAAFKGLRADKPAAEVTREEPMQKPGDAAPAAGSARAVPLTNPDRVYWEDVGLTKQGLADYYGEVWEHMAPHVAGRVISLLRCPEGAGGQCFFQKHATAGLDAGHLHLVREGDGEVISIDSLEGLTALVQAGTLEIHVRGSSISDLEKADRLVFDLDPGPDVAFTDVKRAAREVRDRLSDAGLTSFLKTTGGKGLHVVVPIRPVPWDSAKTFARGLADAMARDDPSRYVATAAKRARTGRVFVDYLRNSREATAVAPYSTRARPGAPVAVPLGWHELGSLKGGDAYRVGNLSRRLARLADDPWNDWPRKPPPLPGS